MIATSGSIRFADPPMSSMQKNMNYRFATKAAILDAPKGRVPVAVIATSYDVWRARTPHPAVLRMDVIARRSDPNLSDHPSSATT